MKFTSHFCGFLLCLPNRKQGTLCPSLLGWAGSLHWWAVCSYNQQRAVAPYSAYKPSGLRWELRQWSFGVWLVLKVGGKVNTACLHCIFGRPYKENGFTQGHIARWVEEKGIEIGFLLFNISVRYKNKDIPQKKYIIMIYRKMWGDCSGFPVLHTLC